MGIFREIINAIIRMFTWLVIVAPWEQAVRVRFGKYTRILRAGVHLKIPFVDRIYKQSIRRRLSIMGTVTLTTKDKQAVTVNGAIGYEIVDLLKLYQTLHQPEDTITYETLGLVSGFIVTRNLADCLPHHIKAHVDAEMDLTRYGLGKQEFVLTSFAVVKTYRLLQGGMSEWTSGENLDVSTHERPY
jgi:hypothetical protein